MPKKFFNRKNKLENLDSSLDFNLRFMFSPGYFWEGTYAWLAKYRASDEWKSLQKDCFDMRNRMLIMGGKKPISGKNREIEIERVWAKYVDEICDEYKSEPAIRIHKHATRHLMILIEDGGIISELDPMKKRRALALKRLITSVEYYFPWDNDQIYKDFKEQSPIICDNGMGTCGLDINSNYYLDLPNKYKES